MRFTVFHNRHHKVSQSVSFFMHCKTVTILLRIRVRGHFVMFIPANRESHYVAVLDKPQKERQGILFNCLVVLALEHKFKTRSTEINN